MAGGLEQDALEGPLQPKAFYASTRGSELGRCGKSREATCRNRGCCCSNSLCSRQTAGAVMCPRRQVCVCPTDLQPGLFLTVLPYRNRGGHSYKLLARNCGRVHAAALCYVCLNVVLPPSLEPRQSSHRAPLPQLCKELVFGTKRHLIVM